MNCTPGTVKVALETLPSELLLLVLKLLRHHDLTQVALVSNRFNSTVEPLLWRDIEIHNSLWHELFDLKQPAPDLLPRQRPYHMIVGDIVKTDEDIVAVNGLDHDELRWEDYDQDSQNVVSLLRRAHDWKSRRFLEILEDISKTREPRMKLIGSRVRSLCTSMFRKQTVDDVGIVYDSWRIFPYFVNLERLELDVSWPRASHVRDFSMPAEPLRKLQSLKLRGYIPRSFLNYVFRSSETITGLELGILDVPLESDRPKLLPGGQTSSGMTNLGGCYIRRKIPPKGWDSDGRSIMSRVYSHVEVTMIVREIRAVARNHGLSFPGSENGIWKDIAPRPLLWFPSDVPSFPKLKSLHLCKPAESMPSGLVAHHDDPILYPAWPDLKCLKEWNMLLRATQESLEHLVLEQRPVVTQQEVSIGRYTNSESIRFRGSGPGEERFIEHVVPELEVLEYPRLKSIDFYGILVADEASLEVRENIREGWSKRGVSCDFHLGWRYVLEDATGEVMTHDF